MLPRGYTLDDYIQIVNWTAKIKAAQALRFLALQQGVFFSLEVVREGELT